MMRRMLQEPQVLGKAQSDSKKVSTQFIQRMETGMILKERDSLEE